MSVRPSGPLESRRQLTPPRNVTIRCGSGLILSTEISSIVNGLARAVIGLAAYVGRHRVSNETFVVCFVMQLDDFRACRKFGAGERDLRMECHERHGGFA